MAEKPPTEPSTDTRSGGLFLLAVALFLVAMIVLGAIFR